ncbi:SusC/RagA family TonB-linked outer membrane protein [Chitinophaga niastensis]|nr:TonB-dependent receptor [Chitinophaga niastensis]
MGTFILNAKTFSQQSVTISGKDLTFKQIFTLIEQQTSFAIVCDNSLLDKMKPVSIYETEVPLTVALDHYLKHTGLTYAIRNKVIIIKDETVDHSPKEPSISPSPAAIIRGIVRDEKGNAIAGASVLIKGSDFRKGIATNAQGEFSLENVPPGTYTLEVTIIGYSKYEKKITVNGPVALLTISLSPSINSLTETVVVAYGTQKKTDLTGAVAVVTAERFKDRPVTSVSAALQGTMPGVTITQGSGQPGRDNGTIRVRGVGTLNNNNPLVIVDGLAASMNDVNPDDVESVSVLKDAASAAIYGSRAANGVVLITTKKGRRGGTQITYNAYVGKQTPTNLPKYLPSWQAATLLNEGLANEGKAPRYTAAEIQKFKDGSDPDNYPNVDWEKLFFQGSGIQQNHYVNFSGGTDNTQYLASLGYIDQSGIIQNTDNKRYTARFNLNTKLSDWGVFHSNIAYTIGDFKEPTNPYTGGFTQYFREMSRVTPMFQYKYSNGVYGAYPNGNPMAWLESNQLNKIQSQNFVGNTGLDINIVKGLSFKPTLGYTVLSSQRNEFIKDIQYYNWKTGAKTIYQGPNSLTEEDDKTNIVTLQAVLEYEKSLKDHHLHVLGGYSQEYTNFSLLKGYRKNFLNNNLNQLHAGSSDGQTTDGQAYEIALQSYFGRINYDYKGKYLLEGNIRLDGSSRFAKANQWGSFPSLSAGWKISEEDFFQNIKKAVQSLKIRTSWGKLGNQVLSSSTNSYYSLYYPAISTLEAGQNYSLNNTIAGGVANIAGPNEAIKWETTESYGVGIDAVLLKNKLTFSADYFVRNTSDILLGLPVGAPFGLTAPQQNGGKVKNTGFEFITGYNDTKGDFTYGASLNASFIKNTVTDLKGTGPIITSPTFLQEGYPVNSFYGYIVEGIFKTQDEVTKHAKQTGGKIGPGDFMYKDVNGDGKIDGSDRVYLGSPFPKVTYGANFNVGWKQLDLVVFFQGAAGVKGYIGGAELGGLGDVVGKPTSLYWQRWTPDNPSATIPRALATSRQNEGLGTPSSAWVKDASYLRLKNLQLGYNFSTKNIEKAGIKKARVYYSGQNILTLTKFAKGFDPEAPVGRGDYYPQVLTHTLGLSVTF